MSPAFTYASNCASVGVGSSLQPPMAITAVPLESSRVAADWSLLTAAAHRASRSSVKRKAVSWVIDGEPWISTLRHIAKEGRVYVLGCCSAMRRSDVPDRFPFKEKFVPDAEWINPGDSVIVNPEGEIIAGPVHEKEEILYAEIDPRQLRGPKWMLDVAGHYARPDVFEHANVAALGDNGQVASPPGNVSAK